MDEEDEHFLSAKPAEVHLAIRNRVPHNKLLTNRVYSGRTGEYWPSVVFVRTLLRSVRTVTTSGQYSPVRPSCSVSKRLILIFEMSEHNDNLKSGLKNRILKQTFDITISRNDT